MSGVPATIARDNPRVLEQWKTPRQRITSPVEKSENDISRIFAPILEIVFNYPITSLFVLVSLGLSSVPVIIFCSFVAITFVMTFLGFLMIEGTLISFAVVILSGALFAVLCLSISISFILAVILSSSHLGYGIAQYAVSLLERYLPGVKHRLTKFFNIQSSKGE